MTYESNASLGNTRSNYFYRFRPRRNLTLWTLVSGTTYYGSFKESNILSVVINGTSLSYSATLASDNTYYLDTALERIYFKTSLTISFVIIEYYLYLATNDISTYSTPTSDITEIVAWEGIVTSSPSVSTSVDLANVGIVSSSTSGVSIANVNGMMDRHLYNTSFNKTLVDIYHALGDQTDDANCALVFTGFCSDISSSETQIDISIQDASAVFDSTFTYGNGLNMHLDQLTFPNIDPNRINDPMPIFLGRQISNVPINISYSSTVSGTTNRTHLVCGWDGSFKEGIFFAVAGVSTTTTTYFTPVYSDRITFSFADYAILCRADGSRVHIDVSTAGSGYITHSALASAAQVGDYLYRIAGDSDYKPRLYLNKAGTYFGELTYLTHYTFDIVHTGNTRYLYFVLANNFESTLGSGTTSFDPNKDLFRIRIDGLQTEKYVTLPNITDISSTDLWPCDSRGELQLRAVLQAHGLPVSTNWTFWRGRPHSLTVPNQTRNFYPRQQSEGLPTLRDMIIVYLEHLSAFMYYDTDGGGWNYRQLKTLSETDVQFEIGESDIVLGSYSYIFDSIDIVNSVRIFVGMSGATLYSEKEGFNYYSSVYKTNSQTKYLHSSDKHLYVNSIDAYTTLVTLGDTVDAKAGRILSIFSQPQGRLSIDVTNVYQTLKIGDVVKVTLKAMAGCEYNESGNSRFFRVESINQNQNRVQLILNDQQGIQSDTTNWPTVQVP